MSDITKVQTKTWSEKDLRAFILKRQDIMLAAEYPFPEGLIGKNTDSEWTPQRADREMISILSQQAEAAWDLWVGDAVVEAMKAIGGDPENETENEALKQALRTAPYDFDHPEGVEVATSDETDLSTRLSEREKPKEKSAKSSSIAALSQP